MDSDSFRHSFLRRAEHAEFSASDQLVEKLERYYALLARWNERINLTSLPLEQPTDQTIDRLFVEPLLASRLVPQNISIWYDLGSGGGSPAIPLQLAHPAKRLIMIESRERKAAFLTEAIRVVPIPDAEVMTSRIEQVACNPRNAGVADLVSIRAVRADAKLFSHVQTLLAFRGTALLFGATTPIENLPRGLELVEYWADSRFVTLRRVGV